MSLTYPTAAGNKNNQLQLEQVAALTQDWSACRKLVVDSTLQPNDDNDNDNDNALLLSNNSSYWNLEKWLRDSCFHIYFFSPKVSVIGSREQMCINSEVMKQETNSAKVNGKRCLIFLFTSTLQKCVAIFLIFLTDSVVTGLSECSL